LTLVGRVAWIATTGNSVAMDVWTPFRMDGLALGGCLALAIRTPGGLAALVPWARLVAVVGGVALGGLLLLPNGRLLGLPLTLYAAFFGAVIVLAVNARPGTWLGRFWNSRTLQFFGKYSYAMYVFQNLLIPLLAGWVTVAGLSASVGSPFWGRVLYIAAMSAATTAVALASWHLYEKHFLRLKRLFGGH
jgi:peptidoglycan/LPS O-acetylase OafA/YrhL